MRYAAAVADAIRKLRPALVEVHNRPEIALALAARLPGIPVTAFIHNDPQDMREAASAAERAEMLRRLAQVVMPSEYLRQRFVDGIASPARDPVVLPNCLDMTELPPPRRRQRLVLFAGRVVENKAPDAFVSACAAALPYLSGWGAEIIGADRFRFDSPDTAFVQMIRSAAEGANIRMLGYRDHPEVLAAMARAAIVVVPSRWPEPFGLVALEAMASGAALICSARGALPEVAGDCALYADPDHPAEIAAAIRLLAGDVPRRAALAEAGRLRARRFEAAAIAEQLAALRSAVLAG
jgi:glycosyltransferase involved in cell wall biosynthesis